MKTRYHIPFICFAIAIASMLFPICNETAYAYTVQEEIKIGVDTNKEILKKSKETTDRESIQQLRNIGAKLTPYVTRKEIPYHFTILTDNEFNAFAVPGGYIYFTKKLWDIMSPDERAGVLSHEMVHVDKRHALDAIQKHQRRRIWTAAILILAGANDYVANAADIVNTLHELQYSRGDEKQADEFGTDMLIKSGLNPAGVLLSMRKIKRFEESSGSGGTPKIFMSHPPTAERINNLTAYLKKKGITIPVENVKSTSTITSIGKVKSVSGRRIPYAVSFNSSQKLSVSDNVWFYRPGWDSKLENKVSLPIAIGKVTQVTNNGYNANAYLLSNRSSKSLNAECDVCLTEPKPVTGSVGEIIHVSDGIKINLYSGSKAKLLDRFVVVGWVWNDESNNFSNEIIGQLTVTEPNSGVVIYSRRPEYDWFQVSKFKNFLVPFKDPDSLQWKGTVNQIDTNNKIIRIIPNGYVEKGKYYSITSPNWDGTSNIDRRIIGTARATNSNTNLDVIKLESGYSISDIKAGYDIYEIK